MRKVTAFLGIAMVSLLVSLFGVHAAPSFAGPLRSMQGPAGYLTFWDGCGSSGFGYCGATWALNAGGGIGVCHALPTGAANHPSAFSNNSGGHNFVVFTGPGCTGSSATLYSGTETGQLAAPFNNNIESQKRAS